MSHFNNKSITNKGLELLSAAMAGGKLEFTRVVMGSGTYSGDMGMIESLVDQKQSLDIKSITRKGSQVILSTTLVQSAIEEDFYWKEIGVYAKGNDEIEILYLYGSAEDTSFISKEMLNEKMINVGVLVSNAQNVSAIIDGSLVYLSKEDLEKHDKDPEAHKPIQDWVLSLFNNINVSSDVEEVVNRRLNTDTSKPLNTLISGWIDTAKTAILNGISSLTSHVTSQHTATKNHVTTKVDGLPQKSIWTDARAAKLDNLNQSISGTQTNIINAINAARDNIKSHVTSAIAPLINGNKVYVPSGNAKYNIAPKVYKANTIIGRFQFKRDGVVRIRGGISSSSTYLQAIYMALYNDSNPEYNPPWSHYNAPVGSSISKASAGGMAVGAPNTLDMCIRVQKGAVAVFYTYGNGDVRDITISEFNVYFDEVSL